MIDTEKDGMYYTIAWPFRERADLNRYLLKQKGTDLDRSQYPHTGCPCYSCAKPATKIKGHIQIKEAEGKCFFSK